MQMLVKALGATESVSKKSLQDLFDTVVGLLVPTVAGIRGEPHAD